MSDSAGLNAEFVGSIYSDIHVTVVHVPERHSTYRAYAFCLRREAKAFG
jgi:hypothetical protein